MRAPTLSTARWSAPVAGERLRVAVGLVEVIDDGGTVNQRLAVVEHQLRYAAQRNGGAHLGAIAEIREITLLVGRTVMLEGDGDTAGIG